MLCFLLLGMECVLLLESVVGCCLCVCLLFCLGGMCVCVSVAVLCS